MSDSSHQYEPEVIRCGNCQTGLRGPFCHMCGQPLRSPVREFFGFVFEGVNELVRPDGKLLRTLASLFFKPGSLTARYLDGQRVHFIKPVKLYFSLSLVLFLLIGLQSIFSLQAEKKSPMIQLDKPVAAAQASNAEKLDVPKLSEGSGKPGEPGKSSSGNKPAERGKLEIGIFGWKIGEKPWNATDNPFTISMLPRFLNVWLNKKLEQINDAGRQARKDPNAFIEKLLESLYQVLPTMMFFLLPIFALWLKLMYFFRRRLFAEHLLVAVQSHSFIFLSIIFLTLLRDLDLFGPASWSQSIVILNGLLIAWIPIYLLIMQKRVYRQGWWATSFKFAVTGFFYVCLLSIGLSFALIAAMADMA